MLRDTVSFLSDFGHADEAVGVVKAVIRDLAPHAHVLDLTHGIDPFDVRAGSLALARAIQYVPAGVVLALVDPGVGTGRRAVAIEVAGGAGVILGPDNGLLAPAVAMAGGAERAVELTDEAFHLPGHGPTSAPRDLFAPVAAHLCNGAELTDLGSELDPALLVPGVIPIPREEDGELVAEVLWVDRFGNAQLNVSPEDVAAMGDTVQLRMESVVRSASRYGTYEEIGTGRVGLVVDSSGLVSVSLYRASAAAELDLAVGTAVHLSGADPSQPVAVPVRLGR